MSSNVLTFRCNGPEGMDPDGVIEVDLVSFAINADINFGYLVSLPNCCCARLFSSPTGIQWWKVLMT